jgi:hypothetical protein
MPDDVLLEGFELPTEALAYRELPGDDLSKIITAAVEAARPLRSRGAGELTDSDVDRLRSLAEVVTNAREAQTYQATRADDLAAAQSIFATEDATGADADPPADPAPTPPKGKPKAPAVAAVAQEGDGQLANALPDAQSGGTAVIVAAPNAPGVPPGSEINDYNLIGKIVERAMQGYGSRPAGRMQTGVAIFKRAFPADLVQTGNGDDEALMEFAATQSRLPGGSVAESVAQQLRAGKSLTAAAGWCAPSQTVYELFELEAATGMVDLPEIQITRGGLRFTPGPTFSDIFGGSGYFHKTEAEVIADSAKPCMVVPCPSFTDVRLEVDGVCISGAILQQRGYPEVVARFTRGAMTVHRHKLNAFVIAAMETGSTVVDFSPYPVAASAVFDDTSAATSLLSTLEMAVVDYRYKHRMAENASLEVVFPIWALAVLRADLSRRTGVQLERITDEFLMSEMRLRGARPQFVYDWQDVATGLATGPGHATDALQQFPQTVRFMLYAPGTFVRGSADVITLDTIYDSVKLATNTYTALFTEEGVLVAKRGHDARVYEVPFCPTGATSAPISINCS